jgi:hypothetical protein
MYCSLHALAAARMLAGPADSGDVAVVNEAARSARHQGRIGAALRLG